MVVKSNTISSVRSGGVNFVTYSVFDVSHEILEREYLNDGGFPDIYIWY